MNKKHFVVDTNILLSDPAALTNFDDNNVYVPMVVIRELDGFKTDQDELGRNSREVQRMLDSIFPDTETALAGYTKPKGGTVKVEKYDEVAAEEVRPLLGDMNKPDHQILAIALQVMKAHPEEETILVTKDVNVRVLARMLGLQSEDLKRDKVNESDIKVNEYPVFDATDHQIQQLYSTKTLDLLPEDTSKLSPGYMLLNNIDKPTHQVPVKYLGEGKFRRLFGPGNVSIANGQTLKPRNVGQKFLVDALYDPEISLITVNGMAGTGKTLMTIAAGLNQVQHGTFDKMIISRPVIPMGKDIGFLPGTAEEKMRPWVQPAYDAVEFLMSRPTKPEQFKDKPQSDRKKEKGQGQGQAKAALKPHEKLMQSGTLEIEVLAQIRGRSIPKAFFIVDEGQNLSPHEAKTIVTRMSEGSKLVILGDPAQIDHPYLDSLSNGLVYVRSRMKNTPVHTHIDLLKGERSKLAELAALNM